MQGNMPKALKKRASKQAYLSPSQLTLDGFETPFEQKLDSTNRWVKLAQQIPWDAIVTVYDQQMRNATTGASHINPRVILGSLMIKHLCNLSDAETLLQIQENMYMQYFIGYSSFSKEAPFDSSLFVEIRKTTWIQQQGILIKQKQLIPIHNQKEKVKKRIRVDYWLTPLLVHKTSHILLIWTCSMTHVWKPRSWLMCCIAHHYMD